MVSYKALNTIAKLTIIFQSGNFIVVFLLQNKMSLTKSTLLVVRIYGKGISIRNERMSVTRYGNMVTY